MVTNSLSDTFMYRKNAGRIFILKNICTIVQLYNCTVHIFDADLNSLAFVYTTYSIQYTKADSAFLSTVEYNSTNLPLNNPSIILPRLVLSDIGECHVTMCRVQIFGIKIS